VRSGAGEQAVVLHSGQALPDAADVHAGVLGEVDEPHRALGGEELYDGGRVAQVQAAEGVLDALGSGGRAEPQVLA